MAFKYHPDRTADQPDSAEMMKAVNEAYAVLSNPAKRQEYDDMRQRFGSSATRPTSARTIRNRIFSTVRTSSRFSKKWPDPSV